jgi:hypothetical protein
MTARVVRWTLDVRDVATMARLLGLAARHVDEGQTGDEGSAVLSDPEGNEFCVLRRGREDG